MTLSMLELITPVILTYNEACNIGRTLSHLSWADEIIVVDSGSTDGTCEILASNPHVRLYMKAFDNHHDQWYFATCKTEIKTPWILRLDADYQIPKDLVQEMSALDPEGPENGYRIAFDYAVYSHRLFASLYPPKIVLLRRGRFSITDAGHTESWVVEGPIGRLNSRIVHDDWKAMPTWIGSQIRYMERELALNTRAGRGPVYWLRSHPPLMPIIVLIYCLVVKGLIFSGRNGIFYALQRMAAEVIYGLLYLEQRCAPPMTDTKRANGPRVTLNPGARPAPSDL